MQKDKKFASLDLFRAVAVVLVIMNHTSPLADVSGIWDFWLTRVLARLAVPFFMMTSGYFLEKRGWASEKRFLKKLCLVYLVSIVIYLPLTLKNGGFDGVWGWLRAVIFDGTLYHLWYFPAMIIGVLLTRALLRLPLPAALAIAVALYLVGLGGDSYYGLSMSIAPLAWLYEKLFGVLNYTRNGLFFAPLFIMLGAKPVGDGRAKLALGFVVSFALMSVEALWLHGMGVQRHDSMYLLLPAVMMFLFPLLLSFNEGEMPTLRSICTPMYVLHPWCIVLIRSAAGAVGLGWLLWENNLVHFIFVLLLSACASVVFTAVSLHFRSDPRRRRTRNRE